MYRNLLHMFPGPYLEFHKYWNVLSKLENVLCLTFHHFIHYE